MEGGEGELRTIVSQMHDREGQRTRDEFLRAQESRLRFMVDAFRARWERLRRLKKEVQKEDGVKCREKWSAGNSPKHLRSQTRAVGMERRELQNRWEDKMSRLNVHICLYTHKMSLETFELTENTGCQWTGEAGNQGKRMRRSPLLIRTFWITLRYYLPQKLKKKKNLNGGYRNVMPLCKNLPTSLSKPHPVFQIAVLNSHYFYLKGSWTAPISWISLLTWVINVWNRSWHHTDINNYLPR